MELKFILGTNQYKKYERALKARERGAKWAERIVARMERVAKLREENLASVTPAEQRFAEILRSLDIDYRREYTILRGDRFYFLDFYCPEIKMGFEIDGGIHKKRQAYDMGRDVAIQHSRLVIQRFTNSEVLETPHKVIDLIKRIARERWSNPAWKS